MFQLTSVTRTANSASKELSREEGQLCESSAIEMSVAANTVPYKPIISTHPTEQLQRRQGVYHRQLEARSPETCQLSLLR